MRNVITLIVAVFVVCVAIAQVAQAVPLVPTVIFKETFDTDGIDATVTYPDFTKGGTGTVSAAGGFLNLTGGTLDFYTNETFSGETFTVKGDVRQNDDSAGGTANGVMIGNRAFAFFGDFLGGAFNIKDINPATAAMVGTIQVDFNMGFTPAQDVFHSFEIVVDAIAKDFQITIFDGNNVGAPFVFTKLADAGFVAGGVGFFNWSGSHSTDFDNLQVIALREQIIPEPSSFLLLGLGLSALGLTRRKRRR